MSGLTESKEWLRWLPYSIRRDGKCEFDLIEKKYTVKFSGTVNRSYYCPNKDELEKFRTILDEHSEDDEQILDAYGPSDMTVYAVYRFVRR